MNLSSRMHSCPQSLHTTWQSIRSVIYSSILHGVLESGWAKSQWIERQNVGDFRFSLHVLIYLPRILNFPRYFYWRTKKKVLIKGNLFSNGIEINLFFRFSNKKMKIEITFVLGDSLLNIKQDSQIYFSDEDFVLYSENCLLFSNRKRFWIKSQLFFWSLYSVGHVLKKYDKQYIKNTIYLAMRQVYT